VLARGGKKRKGNDDYTASDTTAGPLSKRSKNDIKSVTERKPKNTAVYVTHLPLDTDIEELHARFAKFGLIEEDEDGGPKVKMYAKEDGSFSGDALVVYFKEESVSLAVDFLDEAELRIGDRSSVMRVHMAEFGHKNAGPEGNGTETKPRRVIDKKKTTKRIGRMQK
jgi:HIV Tat-specific factor 1